MVIKVLAVSVFLTAASGCSGSAEQEGVIVGRSIALPSPRISGDLSVEEAINIRRSVRNFSSEPLKLSETGQVLWAAGGIRVDAVTAASRTYPSAGGAYPLEFYLVAGDIEGLEAGIYRYAPGEHALGQVRAGDMRRQLAAAALGQDFLESAPAVIAIAADYGRTTQRYGERGVRYVHMDAGHSGENIYLAAASIGLGTVAVGAFDDQGVKNLIAPAGRREIIFLYPIGKPE